MPTEAIFASVASPAIADLTRNIRSGFPKGFAAEDTTPLSLKGIPYVLMIDEINLEQRPRWDPQSNQALGFCREHAGLATTEFNSFNDMQLLFDDLTRGEIHLASEVGHNSK